MPGSHFRGRDLVKMPLRRSSQKAQKAKFAELPSLLKNSFALSSAPGAGAEYYVLVVFRSRFRALLDRRPDRPLLFQQAASFHALR